MLEEIGSVSNIPQFIEDVKSKKKKLMGFGHRVYKNYVILFFFLKKIKIIIFYKDPRARIIRKIAYEVLTIYNSNKK